MKLRKRIASIMVSSLAFLMAINIVTVNANTSVLKSTRLDIVTPKEGESYSGGVKIVANIENNSISEAVNYKIYDNEILLKENVVKENKIEEVLDTTNFLEGQHELKIGLFDQNEEELIEKTVEYIYQS